MNSGRIKIIKNLLKNAQTVPTMQTAPKPATNPVTPAAPAAPSTPAPQPASNVIEPPKTEPTTPVEVPENTVQTTPIVQTEQPKTMEPTDPTEQTEPLESTEASVVYDIVREAIEQKKDKVLTAKYYYDYISSEDVNYITNKTFAAVGIDGLMKLAKINDKQSLMDEKIISLYEPVIANTKAFRIEVFDGDLKNIMKICNKLSEADIDSDIYKFANRYEIKCKAKEEIATNSMLTYLENITSEMKVNLNDLKMGKLKRVYFSLDASGEEGTFIKIG